jgi:hypothetical protein
MDDIIFKDLMGVEIEIGKPVAYPHGNFLKIGFVEKLTPKMVRIKKLVDKKRPDYRSSTTVVKYPHDIIMLNEKLVTMHLMRTG